MEDPIEELMEDTRFVNRLFIRLLVLACFGIVAWTTWVFFHGSATLLNGLILMIDIGVLIWNFQTMRKMGVSFGSVVLTGVLIAVVVVLVVFALPRVGSVKSWVAESHTQFGKIGAMLQSIADNVPSLGTNSNLSFDMVLAKAVLNGDTITVGIEATPNSNTVIGDAYVIQLVDINGNIGDACVVFRFKNGVDAQQLFIQLPDDVSEALFWETSVGREALELPQKQKQAQSRLQKANEANERSFYDYYMGRSVVSYDEAKKIIQELMDAKQSIAEIEREISETEGGLRSRELIGLSISDVLPYFKISLHAEYIERFNKENDNKENDSEKH